jgi:ABC-2 type transport system permease protein
VNLLASELRRLSSRRILLWMSLAMLGFVAVMVIANTATSKPSSVGGMDAMRTTDLWLMKSHARELGLANRNRLVPVSVFSYLAVVAFGASAVGAEYRAGTVTTLLTWEPRRVRLLLTRLVAVALVAMAFFLAISGLFVAGWLVGVAVNGSSNADGEFWSDLVAVIARATAIAGGLAVISAGLATLGKNTAAALGLWFGYLVGVEAILQPLLKPITPGLLLLNIGAFFGGETVKVGEYFLDPLPGALITGAWVLVVGAVAVAVFARRDVT